MYCQLYPKFLVLSVRCVYQFVSLCTSFIPSSWCCRFGVCTSLFHYVPALSQVPGAVGSVCVPVCFTVYQFYPKFLVLSIRCVCTSLFHYVPALSHVPCAVGSVCVPVCFTDTSKTRPFFCLHRI